MVNFSIMTNSVSANRILYLIDHFYPELFQFYLYLDEWE